MVADGSAGSDSSSLSPKGRSRSQHGSRVSFQQQQDGRRVASDRGPANRDLQSSQSSTRNRDREREKDRDRERERGERQGRSSTNPHGHPLYTIPSEPSGSQQSLADPAFASSSSATHYTTATTGTTPTSSSRVQHAQARVEAIPIDPRTQSLAGAAELIASSAKPMAAAANPSRRSRANTTSTIVKPRRSDSPSGSVKGGKGSKFLEASVNAPPSSFGLTNGNETLNGNRRPSSTLNGNGKSADNGGPLARTESYGNGTAVVNGKLAVSFNGKPTNASMTDLIGAPVFDEGSFLNSLCVYSLCRLQLTFELVVVENRCYETLKPTSRRQTRPH